MKNVIFCILVVLLCLAAPCRADNPLTLDARQAHIKTVGGPEGQAWNVWSNGDWGDYLHFDKPGDYTFRVQAYGSPCQNVWPEMAFTVDNQIQKIISVPSAKPAEYVFQFHSQAADHRIAVSFLNDTKTDTEDRNLYIVSLAVEPPAGAPPPTLTTEKAWRTVWTREQIKLEADTLAAANAAIEKNRKTDASLQLLDENHQPLANTPISVELVRHDFLFGGNIYMFDRFKSPKENELYKERFRDLFNYATTGFYWRWYEPNRGKPDYPYTDEVVAWCLQNHIRIKGHPLLWATESGIPPWSKEQPPADIRNQRVADIMTRYAGKIENWEVVNEPAHAAGLEIDEPYRTARQTNPNAFLIVNDYEVLGNGYPAFFDLLQKAIARGVPFDAIGIQAHEPRTMRFPLDQVTKTLDHYATLGKPLHITEFTPTSAGEEITGSHITGPWDEAAQADYAVKFYTVCFAHPAVGAITWWDLSDDGAWRPGGGLLHKDLSPKPAYTALKNLIHQQWSINLHGQTDNHGNFPFRGFAGQYLLKITRNGKTLEQPFHLGLHDHQPLAITLPANPPAP